MLGTCRLCQQTEELQESHIIPAFAFRWLRGHHEGYLRHTQEPNKRVQDGLKLPFLCKQCEGHLNQFETDFANELFYPLNSDEVERVRFGAWLLKFCVSISWRVLRYKKGDGPSFALVTDPDRVHRSRFKCVVTVLAPQDTSSRTLRAAFHSLRSHR